MWTPYNHLLQYPAETLDTQTLRTLADIARKDGTEFNTALHLILLELDRRGVK